MSVSAEEWLEKYCDTNAIDWDKATPVERFKLTMQVPCHIRCFRVGCPVSRRGEACPECGRKTTLPTVWERLLEEERCER